MNNNNNKVRLTPIPPPPAPSQSVSVFKFGVSLFNVLLLGCSMALFAFTIWSLTSKQQFSVLVESPLVVVSILCAAAVVSFFCGVLGCMAVATENRCYLLLYIFLLLLILITEAVAGVISYSSEPLVEDQVSEVLPGAVSISYQYNENAGIKTAIDTMQKEFGCCGYLTYSEWHKSVWSAVTFTENKVPDSCCKTFTPNCGRRDHPSNIWHKGCSYSLASYLSDHLLLLGSVGVGAAALQLVGVILACILYVLLGGAQL